MRFIERFHDQEEKEILSVVEARYIGDFAIRLFFSDGHQKLVDFKPFLEQAHHPSIRKYLDESLFKSFSIVDGNLDWNDYDLCFPLEDLYGNCLLKEAAAPLPNSPI